VLLPTLQQYFFLFFVEVSNPLLLYFVDVCCRIVSGSEPRRSVKPTAYGLLAAGVTQGAEAAAAGPLLLQAAPRL
jgi:hypothetical protein